MTGRHTGRTSRRVRPAMRWFAIVSVIVLTPLAVHAAWDYVEIRRLVREIEAIKAKGEPVNQAQAGRGYRRLTGPERRASAYYLAAAALAAELTDRSRNERLSSWHEWLAGGVEAAPDLLALDRDLGAAVEAGADALRLVDTANSLPFEGFGAGTDYSYRTGQLLDVSRLITARTLHFSLAGRGNDAAESALGALRLRRALRNPPWYRLQGHQVPGLLSLSSPSPDWLERLQTALEAEEAAFSLEEELAQERAVQIDAVWSRYYGVDPDAPHVRSLPMRSIAESLTRPWFTHGFVATLRKWAELMEAARRPWPEKSKAIAAVFDKYPPDDRPARLGIIGLKGLMVAAFWHSDVARRSGYADFLTDRCSRVAVAVERFRRDNGGEVPAGLEQLVPKYLTEVPMDPATGHPVRYGRDAVSYTIYSVGSDGVDDGGDLSSELRAVIERGWGRRAIRGRDEGVRVLIRTSQ